MDIGNDKTKKYVRFLSLGSWLNGFLYGMPAVVLLVAMYLLGVPSEWWTPILLIYLIAALADSLNYGFMALNIQMKIVSDYWEKNWKNWKTRSRQPPGRRLFFRKDRW